jgi:hypothetical protein
VYDGISGADITKTFSAKPAALKPVVKVEPKKEPEPVAVAKPKPVEKPAPAPVSASNGRYTSRNHFGISAGMSTLKKNKDSVDSLAQNSSGKQSTTYDNTSGRFRLFYEHDFSAKYGFGMAAGAQKGGDEAYNNSGKTLNITAAPKSATLYITRHFGRHFGLYLGGGVDFMAIDMEDQSDLAGIGVNHSPYKANVMAPNGEAGMILSAGGFSLRFSLKKIMGASSDDISTAANGTNYRLIIRNGKTLAYKTAGQALASNEQYFKLDFGGFSSAVTLNYAFAGW